MSELRKVSATQIKLSEKPAGFSIEGKLVTISKRETVDAEGEVKEMHTMVIETDAGERLKFLADGGIRTQIADCAIMPGDWFKAVKGEKINIGRGRSMNQWDIFQK